MIRTLILLGVLWLVTTARTAGATAPEGVPVVYAFVPKERLSEAVKGKREALEIEEAWRTEAMSKSARRPYPLNIGSAKYSVVVFVDIPSRFALFGKIGIPIQNQKNPLVVNVNLSPGYSGTYVIDGGGLILAKGIPPEPKPYEWLEVRVQ